ncbi:MAG: glycosyltransferase family 4 protein, partial [Bacillota bacterium]|nr:glycosyltransferase family 4 protein [Bacillota bacterium]
MKIAMLSPISWRTPPRHYGPWEWVVSMLTEGLVKRGLDVTLYATADSLTS